ncbi:glycerophosphoryl diester phosphodiesterase [Moheibacter sediminis]|uniref:Glycerophosphoryl diester phosphodiesterase n=2 Tax=Moheibacter sediminis TaxID=1434700 RepID=A0A1W2C8J9_9FLAO|nr:glycerophosphoryl diester phosphodiesterase [Moheibacter sediminis]
MTLSVLAFSQTKVIAHRGAFKAQNLPENSIAALEEAARIGCFASEFDVRITKDGEIIVHHDDDVDGLIISETNLKELRKHKLPNGEKIPTLEEYLKAGKKLPQMRLVLEVKKSKQPEMTLEAARKSVEWVKKLKLEHQVDYITFDFEAGKLIAELNPDANVAYLEGDKTPEQAKTAGYNGLDYHYSVYQKNPNWIEEAHDLGMTINAWTVNEEADMNWLIEQEADFITTNEPELLIKLLH